MKFNNRYVPSSFLWWVLLVSVFALAAALIAEFGFHIAPCLLCLVQRVPFAIAIIIAGVGLLQRRTARPVVAILGVLFLISTGIAVYQIGVENKIWGLTAAGNSQVCTASNLSADNIKDLYQSMSGTVMGDCAHPAFNFHGITFAVMNAFLSLLLASAAARRFFRRP